MSEGLLGTSVQAIAANPTTAITANNPERTSSGFQRTVIGRNSLGSWCRTAVAWSPPGAATIRVARRADGTGSVENLWVWCGLGSGRGVGVGRDVVSGEGAPVARGFPWRGHPPLPQ